MKSFLQRFQAFVLGVLCGFDLFGEVKDAAERKRQLGKVTRMLRMLRGHGLILKISKTHRYQLTDKGRSSSSALLAARNANTKQLLQAA